MFDYLAEQIPYQTLIKTAHLQLDVKRLDLIHPDISGNKFFKLKENFKQARQQGLKQILTFGGAFSNHIAATAAACQQFGFKSVGIIRGEELAHQPLNTTLAQAQKAGMHLHFVSRQTYRQRHNAQYQHDVFTQFPNSYLIPEGGTNALAVLGCQDILNHDDLEQYDFIAAAVGTGGTLAGLIEKSRPHQQILGFSALKGDFLQHDIQQWTPKTNWSLTDAFCCGGYAKTTPELLAFMQQFEHQYQIPLEQVYTAKMFYGLFQLIEHAYFKPNCRILAIHSGGLQGRLALINPL